MLIYTRNIYYTTQAYVIYYMIYFTISITQNDLICLKLLIVMKLDAFTSTISQRSCAHLCLFAQIPCIYTQFFLLINQERFSGEFTMPAVPHKLFEKYYKDFQAYQYL